MNISRCRKMVSGSNSLKCLMIGQAGIGKTSLLNSLAATSDGQQQQQQQQGDGKETYAIEIANDDPSPFDFGAQLRLQIDNYDIEIETCLHENDLVINNKIIPSNQIINVSNYKIIMFCYAVNDQSSFDLIKSKWDIDLKKLRSKLGNLNNHHQFMLMALKSDLLAKEVELTLPTNDLTTTTTTRKRTCSTHLDHACEMDESSKKKRLLIDYDDDEKCDRNSKRDTKFVSTNQAKKFAKSLNAKLVQVSTTDKSGHETMRKALIDSCSMTNNRPVKQQEENKKKTLHRAKMLPKSMSAPINSLFSGKNKRKQLIDYRFDAEQGDLVLVDETGEQKARLAPQQQQQQQLENGQNLTLKQKLSQFFVGFGTYIVTCGAHKARTKGNNNNNSNYSKNKNKLLILGKNKSWLLLGSEMSLNTLANDEVFVN